MDAFHLEPVPDVDAGGAGRNAGDAVDAVARAFAAHLAAAPRLAAIVVVRDDQRLPIEQRGLPPSIWARDQTGLFTEPGEVRKDESGRHGHDQERDRVLTG